MPKVKSRSMQELQLGSLYESMIWDSEEASVKIFSLDVSRWDYKMTTTRYKMFTM